MSRSTAKQEEPPKLAWEMGVNALSLMSKQFAPIRYVVEGYVAEGLTLLAGAPKLGKSWWSLNVAVAVAGKGHAFGSIPVEHGDVLYLALEDNQRRLQSRLRTMGVEEAPSRLTLCTDWPTIANGAVEQIELWAESVPNPTLVIVDVIARVRDPSSGRDNSYEVDYRAMTGLQRLASCKNLAIIAVHHTRKMAADDPFDSVSGTRGLTGAADSVLVLKRSKGDRRTVLYGRGRDIPEIETAFDFNEDNGTWQVVGSVLEVGKTAERQLILKVLLKAQKPLSAQEVADEIGKKQNTVRKTLNRMAEAGEVTKPSRGKFACLKCPNVPSLSV